MAGIFHGGDKGRIRHMFLQEEVLKFSPLVVHKNFFVIQYCCLGLIPKEFDLICLGWGLAIGVILELSE